MSKKMNKVKTSLLATAGAAAAFGVADAASADTITVQAGDTVNQLAEKYGISADQIASDNNLQDANLILAGATLEINDQANTQAVTGLSADGKQYTVQAGDTLSKIAQTTGVDVATLQSLNGLADVNNVIVGAVLNLQAEQVATSTVAEQAQPAQVATATSAQAENTAAPVATAATQQPAASTQADGSVQQQLLNSLNAKRAALGLAPVSLDAGLSAQAQSRAENAAANGGIPTNHFSTNGEVVANGFSVGSVIDAWYNETNMITNGTPGHQMWVANVRATSVGFGVVGDIIVGVSNVGQY